MEEAGDDVKPAPKGLTTREGRARHKTEVIEKRARQAEAALKAADWLRENLVKTQKASQTLRLSIRISRARGLWKLI